MFWGCFGGVRGLFWCLGIKENLIFGTFIPTPETPGDPREPRKALYYTTRKGPMNTHPTEVLRVPNDVSDRLRDLQTQDAVQQLWGAQTKCSDREQKHVTIDASRGSVGSI